MPPLLLWEMSVACCSQDSATSFASLETASAPDAGQTHCQIGVGLNAAKPGERTERRRPREIYEQPSAVMRQPHTRYRDVRFSAEFVRQLMEGILKFRPLYSFLNLFLLALPSWTLLTNSAAWACFMAKVRGTAGQHRRLFGCVRGYLHDAVVSKRLLGYVR